VIGRSILITGGAGFIGYHLSKRLAAESHDRIVLVENFSRGRNDRLLAELMTLPNVSLIEGDLGDPTVIGKLGSGYDEVYHLAALLGVENVLKRPVDTLKINTLLTMRMLDWFVASNSRRFLFSSTSEAYAWTQQFHELPIPTPEDVPLSLTDLSNARSTYAGSKIFGELCTTQFCLAAGAQFTIVRYHNVYGPRMGYDHVIPQIHERLLAGESPLVVYSADHRRAFCYIDDAVTATIAAMRHPAGKNQTFNIGNEHEEASIFELAEMIVEESGLRASLAPKEATNDPIVRRCPSIQKAARLIAFSPTVTLREGLKRTLAWYSENRRP